MKLFTLLIMILVVSLSSSSFASEFTISLKNKVSKSSLVVVGTVVSVKLGEIQKAKNSILKNQELELKLKIDETIYGKEKGEITVTCYSASYTTKPTARSCISIFASAGFSANGISKGKKYIAYLKKKAGKYYLSGDSNQYLEEVDDYNKTIEACGQNGNVVSREAKLKKIRELAVQKEGKVVTAIRLKSPVKELRPTLKWKKYPEAHSYYLSWFEIDPVTKSSIKAKQHIKTEDTEYKFKEDLVPNRIYQWQIVAHDKEGRMMTAVMSPNFYTGSLTIAKVKVYEAAIKKKKEEVEKTLGIKTHNFGPPFISGVKIKSIIGKGSIARSYGLKVNDVIIKCNGQPIKNINDLYEQINQYKYGFYIEFVRHIQIPPNAIKRARCNVSDEVEKLYKEAEVSYKNKEYAKVIVIIKKIWQLDIYNKKAIKLLRKTYQNIHKDDHKLLNVSD